jgi:hypothetical protein
MLDYYGSIIQQEEDIDRDLMQVFKSYRKIFISDLIQTLREEQILTKRNSVSGYCIFVRPTIINIMKERIQKQTDLNLKKLKFTSYYLKNYNDIDVLQYTLSFIH